MIQNLEFSENPNGKLFCDIFNHIDLHDPEKHKTGNVLNVLLNKKVIGQVTVVAVRTLPLRNISDMLSFLDIGKSPSFKTAQLREKWHPVPIGPDTRLDHILVRYVSREIAPQTDELFKWWRDTEKSQSAITQSPNQIPI